MSLIYDAYKLQRIRAREEISKNICSEMHDEIRFGVIFVLRPKVERNQKESRVK